MPARLVAPLFVVFICLAAAPSAVGGKRMSPAPADDVFHTSMFLGPGLASVSCVSARVCVAVGERSLRHRSDTVVAERWNGTAWTVQRTPSPVRERDSSFNAVSCTARLACVAVGEAFPGHDRIVAVAEGLRGGSWSVQRANAVGRSISSDLRGVSCTSPTHCIAVGVIFKQESGVPLAQQWDGRRWSVLTTPAPRGISAGELSSVSCASAKACTAVGDWEPEFGSPHTLVERWDGRRWSIQASPSPAGYAELEGVSCPSTATCTAVGIAWERNGRVPVAERWDGSGWSTKRIPKRSDSPDGGLNDVSCSSADACTAVGWALTVDGAPHIERWNGRRWTDQATPGGVELMGVSCPSLTACKAVGVGDARPAVAETWDGTSWSVDPVPA
jgi:hypothetical protein